MLKSLYIENFAIVDEALISFESGFSVITGETGVGKSLLIDALNVALGERAYKDLIREGTSAAVVEANFDLDGLERNAAFHDQGIKGSALSIKREIRQQGASQVWINGRQSTVQELKKLGDLLVDLHGQHEHQYLLNEEHHIDFLDDFAGLRSARGKLAVVHGQLLDLKRRLRELEMDRHRREEQRQLFAFQVQELNDLNPQEGELENLAADLKVLENAQQISELVNELVTLAAGDQGATRLINRMNQVLEGLSSYTHDAGAYLPELASARVSLQEVADFGRRFQTESQADPQRLEEAQQRLHQLNRVCQKYNKTYPELLEYHQYIKGQLAQNQPAELEKADLENQIRQVETRFTEQCQALSAQRQREARNLTKAILEKLHRLGIPKARFEIVLEQVADEAGLANLDGKRFTADARGMDQVAFWMQANPGEPLRPLARIASGGEISRVMLALKASMSGRDRVQTVIFDEIDAGISGKIARVVGRELKALGQHHQLICITHLPQIASMADTHYRVAKTLKDGRTVTRVTRLGEDQRLEEVALLLGDGAVSDAVLETARQLMNDKPLTREDAP